MERTGMSVKEMRRAEVLGRLKRKELRLREAADLLGVGYRQAKRLKRRYGESGAKGLAHRGAGRRSNRAKPEAERGRALDLIRKHYGGERQERFGPTLAAEHLGKEHGIAVNEETLRRWMLKEGLWSRERKWKAHRKRRERKEHFGELVQMDGSFHAWLEGRAGVGCLMDMVDDASGTTEGQFGEQESTWAAADACRAWVEKYGIPMALYVDHKNVYVRPPTPAEELRGEEALTQFGGMCKRLGTRIIAAGSPQAKGRIERGHGTHQDRMIKKMRLKGIGDYQEANAYLRAEYWQEHNERFGVEAASKVDYHRKVPRGMNLDEVFSLRSERVLSQDWVVRHENRLLQVEARQRVRPRQKITVEEQRSGKLRLLAGGGELRWHEIAALPRREAPQPRPATTEPRTGQPSASPWRRMIHNAARVGLAKREQAAMEMTGHASCGNQTAVSTARTALGNPANSAGFPHSHR